MVHSLSKEEIARHNAFFTEGCRLQKGLILLDDRPILRLGFFARRKLRKSISLLKEASQLNPTGWQSMMFIGKAYQALGEAQLALDWFLRANREVPANGAIAKEAGLQAGRMSRHDLAVTLMEPASLANPNDAALHVNLGLSCLLSGQALAACFAFERACEVEPQRPNNAKLLALAKQISDGKVSQPTTEAEIAKLL